MYDKSLRTNDISGAQPKGKRYQKEQQQLQNNQAYNYQQLNQQQNIFQQYEPASQLTYQQEIFFIRVSQLKQSNYSQQPMNQQKQQVGGGRKLFNMPQPEIVQNQIFSQPKNLFEQNTHNEGAYSRSLQTNDIQGTKPGSLASAAVKNQQKAQQIAQQNQIFEQQQSQIYFNQFIKGAYQEYQEQQDNYQQRYPQQQQQPIIQNNYEQYEQKSPNLENAQQFQYQQQQYQNPPQIDENQQQKLEDEKKFLQNMENYYRGMTPSINSRKEYGKIQDNLIKAREEKIRKVDEQLKHEEQIYSSDQFINDISTFYDGEKLIKQKQYPGQGQSYQQEQTAKNYNQYEDNQHISQLPTNQNNQQAELEELQSKIKMLEQMQLQGKQQPQAQQYPQAQQHLQQQNQSNYQRYNPPQAQNSIQARTGNQILNAQAQQPQDGKQKNIHRFGGGLKNMGFM